MNRLFIPALFMGLLFLAGCSSKELVLLTPEDDLFRGTPEGGQPTMLTPTPVRPVQTGTTVVIDTNFGQITVALEDSRSPITVENFLTYVRDGFYDGTIFHRVIPGFVIQGGGLTVDMKEKETRPSIRNEASNGLANERGTLAMARRDAIDSATAQFFINLRDNPFLNYDGPYNGYAVFGRVVAGMEIVDQIAAVNTANKGDFENVPVEPVIVRSITIQE